MALSGPINYKEINVDRVNLTTDSFTPSIAYTSTSSYLPRFDYGGGVVDIGNTPASRLKSTATTGTTTKIGFCTFAQGNINLSGMSFNGAGVENLITGLSDSNPSSLNYSNQYFYNHADDSVPYAKTIFEEMELEGWTRTGTYDFGSVIFDIETSSPSQVFTLPLTNNGDEEFSINWGDGSTDEFFTTHNDVRLSHTYSSPGIYTIVLRGNNARIYFNNGGSKDAVIGPIVKLELDKLNVTAANYMFYGCVNLTGYPNLNLCSNLASATGMFFNCFDLTVIPDLTSLSSLLFAEYMFQGCSSLTGTPNFTTLTSLENANQMFYNCPGLSGQLNLTGLTNLTSGSAMFLNCSGFAGQLDLSPLESLVEGVQMFQSCTGLTSLLNLNSLTSLINGTQMFQVCTGITGTPNLTGLTSLDNGTNMFYGCSGITGSVNLSQLTSLLNATSMFRLTNINGFTLGGPLVTNWVDTFHSCLLLDAADIDSWLIWLDANGPLAASFRYDGLASSAHFDANRSAPALTAKNNLIAKGWTRTGTYA